LLRNLKNVMSITTVQQIEATFQSLLDKIGEKEGYVVSHRVGLSGYRETLQEIWDRFGITRERVRQVEDKAIKELGGIIPESGLFVIQELARKFIRENAGIMSRDQLISKIIKELSLNASMNKAIIRVIVQADFDLQKSKPKLHARTYFYEPRITRRCIDTVHETAKQILSDKGDVMEQQELYKKLIDIHGEEFSQLNTHLIDSIMDVFDDIVKGEEIMIGLASWHILNPKTLKDKAISIFKKRNEPMHFLELANAIADHFKKPVKVNTVHNELIRNSEFVLIGRWIYALKTWGFKTGTVKDVMKDVFERVGTPMTSDELTEEVLKTRRVKANTIYMNLQNKKMFERVGRNLYQLKGM